MKGLGVGRIVHYQAQIKQGLDDGVRPAIITHVWNDDGMVNLLVFLDGSLDVGQGMLSPKTSVAHAEDKVGYWHWPTLT